MEYAELSRELEVYQAHRDQWVRSNAGKFVAIRDSEILDGFFSSYSEALKAAVNRFGVHRSFLVKQISSADPVYFVF